MAEIFRGKPYDCFLLLGRFQPMHIGHESLINIAFQICDRGLLLIGSSQESGTERNPFDINTRTELVRAVYGDALDVRPIEDMTSEKDVTEAWGDFVLARTKRYISKAPSVTVYGNDEFRSKWFSPEAIKDTLEIVVPRSKIPISATMMRDFILFNQPEEWFKYTNPKLHKYFERLRSELLAVPFYKERLAERLTAPISTTWDT